MKNTVQVVFFMTAMALLPSGSRAQDDTRLVNEGVVNAPIDQVWAAFTTREGLESWRAAHAKIELKIGGTMKIQVLAEGTIDDAKAVEYIILSYDPMRMLSLKVTKAPDVFPFPNAIKNIWTVFYFVPEGDKATRVREVSMGFGNDDESKRMLEYRLDAKIWLRLQERFAAKPDAK